ncbi:uncharacterized protein E0L32_007332 [Thyridium curvatum]|uniref:Uncharacterized protein n=1 Tax=Thyridium curvatum TaxID=1093900 RepID=A0A507B3W8_9PEZI|nr:uncharacterized protein E0L32_007332 [Thyridium curvatum]TPX12029.1 hypothetical protein E0L32_007332 [Thyridium curvatum]
MPTTIRSRSSANSTSSRSSSHESFESMSSVPTTVSTSPMPSLVKTSAASGRKVEIGVDYDYVYESGEEDLSPATNCCARASVDTYASTTVSEEDLSSESDHSAEYEYQDIPPLPLYRGDIVEPNVRPSNPQDFAKLFPSMNRLSIRHDEFTPDGNMNLRVDTAVPRRRHTVQLFHLRMYDLAKREFSLRRYCRESGREVCNSKRKYVEPASESRPNLQRSMSSAIKTLGGKPGFKRTNSGGSVFSNNSPTGTKRPTTSHSSSSDGFDDFSSEHHSIASANERKSRPMPTNTIKLEFSNYARVDVTRRGGKNAKRYEFEWWGHRYSWKRVIEKHTGIVSFHLLRDGKEGASIAHIVPETRSPNQIRTDDEAGGWVPPCHMWFTDEAVLNARTDVADVIIATGLMALVDDCIKEKWQVKKSHRIPVPLTNKSYDVGALMQHVFSRRNSAEQRGASPLQYAKPISAC